MENSKNGYIKWWQFITIMVSLGLFLAGSMIANDRIRACEDQRIEASFSTKLEVIQRDLTEMKVMLAKLSK